MSNTNLIDLIEQYDNDGETEGYSIMVNDCDFGYAIACQNSQHENGFNAHTGVGTFFVKDDVELAKVLKERIEYVSEVLV